jgi:hypothetical protein
MLIFSRFLMAGLFTLVGGERRLLALATRLASKFGRADGGAKCKAFLLVGRRYL